MEDRRLLTLGDLLHSFFDPATELVFVDSGVDDDGRLVLEAGRFAEVIVLDADRDGIQQISQVLAGREGIAAVHIVSHGAPGQVVVGSARLDAGSLGEYADELAAWSGALTPDADILLYGCRVGAGPAGQGLLDDVVQLTGADVAASDDPTGAADRGGDWDLEVARGTIETVGLHVADYDHLLATFTKAPLPISGGGWFAMPPDWGDMDNDGDLDIRSICTIRNDGPGGFTTVMEELDSYPLWIFDYPIVGDKFYVKSYSNDAAPPAWADIDGDGDMDGLTAIEGANTKSTMGPLPMIDFDRDGDIDYAALSDIYILENGVLESRVQWVPLGGENLAWGDYDNDGDLDVMITNGFDYFQGLRDESKLYRNVNGVAVEDTSVTFPVSEYTGASWGDYDNDGDLDLMWSGFSETRLYRNDDGVLVHQVGAVSSSMASNSLLGGSWADFDNDGDLDILLGERLLVNDNGVFIRDAATGLDTQFRFAHESWADYDNDGDLDATTHGHNTVTGKWHDALKDNHIWTNHTIDGVAFTPNQAPAAPGNLQAVVNGSDVTFTWDRATDDKTPQDGLNYNLYLYEEGQITYIRAPESFPATHAMNGRRMVPNRGMIQWSAGGYTLKGVIEPGKTYYWSVQAIDTGFAGGAFATEQMIGWGLDLTDGSDTGDSTTDDVTSDTTPTFTVTLHADAEAGDTLELLLGGASLGTTVTHTLTADDVAAGSLDMTVADGADLGADGVKSFSVELTGPGGTESSPTLAVTIDTIPPALTNNGLRAAQGSTANVIGAAQLEATDARPAAALTFTLDTVPDHGTLYLDHDGNNAPTDDAEVLATGETFTQADIDAGRLKYDQDGSDMTVDSFLFDLADSAGNRIDDRTFTITDTNDAPAATNTTQTIAYIEGDASVPLAPAIVVTDPDVGESITATLTLAETATGVLTANDGATYTPGTGVWTITGTVAAVNTALAGVAFQPVATNTSDTTVAVHIADGGEDGAAAVTGTLTLDVTPLPRDFGDAPDGYRTLDASGGAKHVIVADLYLGAAAPDADSDGFGDGTEDNADTATDDDAHGSDDEDGVAAFTELATGAGTYSVDVTVTNHTGGAATLVGWIDFDGDRKFQADEGTTATVADGTTGGTATLTWVGIGGVGPNIAAGATFARFRLSTDAGLTTRTPGGGAAGRRTARSRTTR